MTFATLPMSPVVSQPGVPLNSMQPAKITLIELRPVIDIQVKEAQLPKLPQGVSIDESTTVSEAMNAWGITDYKKRPAGKIMNEVRLLETFNRSDLGGRALAMHFAFASEVEPDADTAAIQREIRGLGESIIGIEAHGETRMNVVTESGAYLHKGAGTLYFNEEQQADFLDALRAGVFTEGAGVLCLSGVSDVRNLPFLGEIQRIAAELGVKIVVDAKDETLNESQGRDQNTSLTTLFHNASHARDAGKIALAKPNLEEFAALVKTFLGEELNAQNLNYALRDGKSADFEAAVLPLARRLAELCLIPGSGQLILTCGGNPFYVITAGKEEVLKITPAKVNNVSAIGAGDSTLAMAALFLAFDTAIGPDQARFLAAAGAATVEQPGSELGTMKRILEIANDESETGVKVETIRVPLAEVA